MNSRRPAALFSWLGPVCLLMGCTGSVGSGDESQASCGQSPPCLAPGSSAGPGLPGAVSASGPVRVPTDPQGTATSPEALFFNGQPAANCDPSLVGRLGYMPLRRLTETQYQKTVEDLFMQYGIALDPALVKGVPGDGLAGAFPSNAEMDASEQHVRAYETSAQAVAATVTTDANFPMLVGQCDSGEAVCAQAFITNFAGRAFRHALNDEQIGTLSTVYQAGASTGLRDGVALVVEAVLQSPEFLYHVESKLAPAVTGPGAED